MLERIASGPDRLTLIAGFADMKEIIFFVGGASVSKREVIIAKISHKDDSADFFYIEGYSVKDMKKFTGHYKTTNKTGQLEW